MSRQKNNKKSIFNVQNLIIITLILFVGFGVYAIFTSGNTDGGQSNVKEVENTVTIDYNKQPAIGSPDAPVKLIEFGDFKCPSCKVFYDTIYPQLKKEYIDTGKVQLYFVNLQFLAEDSITAGIAGESVFKQNPQAFWKFYEAIYANQGDQSEIWATPEFLTDLVKKHVPEVDAEQVAKDIQNRTYENEVNEDRNLAQQFEIRSVPSIVINGKKVLNQFTYEDIKNVIEEELKSANGSN